MKLPASTLFLLLSTTLASPVVPSTRDLSIANYTKLHDYLSAHPNQTDPYAVAKDLGLDYKDVLKEWALIKTDSDKSPGFTLNDTIIFGSHNSTTNATKPAVPVWTIPGMTSSVDSKSAKSTSSIKPAVASNSPKSSVIGKSSSSALTVKESSTSHMASASAKATTTHTSVKSAAPTSKVISTSKPAASSTTKAVISTSKATSASSKPPASSVTKATSASSKPAASSAMKTSSASSKPPTSSSTSKSTSKSTSSRKTTSSTASASPSPSTGLTTDQQNFLDLHNSFRPHYGAATVTWNSTLASYAASAAKTCVYGHTHGPYGENIAAGVGGGYDLTAGFHSWSDESQKYNYSDPGYSDATGHFTQIVWKATTQIGCAAQKCADGTIFTGYGQDSLYLVCEYQVAGNWVDPGDDSVTATYFRENVGPYQA